MIASLVYTFMFLFFGVMTVRFLLPRHRPLNRLWLGLSLGLLEEMWLPALGAFLFAFDAAAHAFAAGILFILTTACWFLRDRRTPAAWDGEEDALLRQLLIIGIPLTVLAAWLQYTHVMRVDEAGNWRVGWQALSGHKRSFPLAVMLPPPARGPGTLIPSAQRLVWAAKHPLGNAALGALFA